MGEPVAQGLEVASDRLTHLFFATEDDDGVVSSQRDHARIRLRGHDSGEETRRPSVVGAIAPSTTHETDAVGGEVQLVPATLFRHERRPPVGR